MAGRDAKADPRLPFSTWQVLVGAVGVGVTVVVGMWGLSTFVLSTVKDDIATIRSDVAALGQKADTTIITENTKDGEIRSNLGDVVGGLELATQRLDQTSADVSDLFLLVKEMSFDLGTLRSQVERADLRQIYFERFVVAQIGIPFESLPEEWRAQTRGISESLIPGGNPLPGWAERTRGEN